MVGEVDMTCSIWRKAMDMEKTSPKVVGPTGDKPMDLIIMIRNYRHTLHFSPDN